MSIGGVVAMGGATPTKTPYGLGGNNKVGVSFSILIDKGPPFLSLKQESNQVTKVFGWQVNNSFLCGIWHLSINPILCLCHLIYYGFNLSVLSLSFRD